MTYYISILYARKNPDGSIPEGYDMEFADTPDMTGKRVTYPNYHGLIPNGKLKLASSQEIFSPYRKGMRLTVDTYEITKKTYESMEEKPPLSEIKSPDGKKKMTGWIEHDHQDNYSEVRKYIVKGL